MGDNGNSKDAGDGSLDAAQTQPEIDFENHQLGTTVKLSDGTEGRIFSRGARNKDGHLAYTCHLCMVVNLPGERVMLTHIAGRKHQNRLSHPVIDADTFRKISAPKTSKIQMHIAPGEPVPPGMENEVKPVAELQGTIDRFKEGPLVGLEYVMELTSPSLREPSYHCVLCDKKGDPRTIVVHITSYIHRSKFLEKHYPTAINELAQWRGQKGCKDVIGRVIQTVCEAIEDHHGRMTPNVHEVSDYNRNKTKYLQEVLFEKHFDERTGPKFVEVIDKKALHEQLVGPGTTPIVGERARDPSPPVVAVPAGPRKSKPARADRKSLDSISSMDSVQSISSSESKTNRPPGDNRIRPLANTFDDRNPVRVEQARLTNRRRSPLPFRRQSPPFRRVGASPVRNSRFNRRSRSPPPRRRSRSPMRRRSPAGRHDRSPLRFNDRKSPSPSKEKQRNTLPTPKQLALQASEIAHERYKWEKYRCSLEIATAQIDKIFKEHEKNPEKHPLYPEEWKMFWNRRYKELQNEKKDPSKHDFKPEWIEFWTKRMKELRDEEVEKKKIEIRTKLNLPSEDSEKTDALKEQYTVKVTKKKKERSVEPIESDEDDRMSVKSRSSVRQKPARAVRRSRSPISDEERSRHSRREHRSPKPAPRPRRSRSPISEEERGSRRRDFNSRDRSFHRGPGFGDQHDYDEWAKTYYGHKKVFVREEFDNYSSGTLSFVAVCRLLTALEEYLGSLGPRVIDLLAKALALEKVKANSSDELLLNEDNSMFLETVKEKLKGCLMAELLEPQMITPVKKAIRNIASLLHEASKKEKPAEPVMDDPLPISGPPLTAGGVDKAAIAQKLAAALVAQGKTDFTSAELEELINVYVAMAEASKDKEKPVTTSTFLSDVVAGPSKQAPAPSAGPSRRRAEEPADNTEANALEGLTDSDLQTLLQNFKDLSNEEQLHLISHLKKLEKTDPVRVEKLRRYVNLDNKPQSRRNDDFYPEDDDQYNDNDIPDFADDDDDVGRFEDNSQNFNPRRTLNQPTQIKSLVSGSYEDDEHDPSAYAKPAFVDSEEEDYSYDDVVRAASKNVVPPPAHSNSNSLQGPPPQSGRIRVADFGIDQHDSNSNFSQRNTSDPTLDAANIVANLMGTLAAKNTSDARQSYYDNGRSSSAVIPQPAAGAAATTNNNPASTYQSIYAGLGPNGKPLSATNNFMNQNQRPQFAPIQTANTSLNSMPYYYQQQMRAQQQMQQQTQQQQQQQTQQQQQQQQPGSYGGYGAGQQQQQLQQQQTPSGGGQYQGYGNNYY